MLRPQDGLPVCAPLLRTHLLGFMAAVDATVTTCLVLLCIQGNVWFSLFPPGWPSREAYAVSLGDVVALLGLRWCFVTGSSFGTGFLLTFPGICFTACAHTLTTLYFIAKLTAALAADNDEGHKAPPRLGSMNLYVAVDAFSIIAIWAQFLLTLRSLALLRWQLHQDRLVSNRGLSCAWLDASDRHEPLLGARETGAAIAPEPVGLTNVQCVSLTDAVADDGEGSDGDSACSFHTTRSDHSAASSFASAVTHHTQASSSSYASLDTHTTSSAIGGHRIGSGKGFWGRWRP